MVQKGWRVYFGYALYGDGYLNWGFLPKKYDITRENGFIDDASQWNKLVYQLNDITITSVENEVAYNGTQKVCDVDSS
jgi:hypothetical protein